MTNLLIATGTLVRVIPHVVGAIHFNHGRSSNHLVIPLCTPHDIERAIIDVDIDHIYGLTIGSYHQGGLYEFVVPRIPNSR